MANGTVKFFNTKKGYGFITSSDGNDVFTHISGVESNSPLKDGEKVSYDLGNDRQGRVVAINVRQVA